MATQIFNDDGFLNFSMGVLASIKEFQDADRCIGSIFEALEPGELVELKDGTFVLDSDLDLVQSGTD